MYKPMRRKDRVLEKNEAIELLVQGEYGILSTIRSDGIPYGVPLSYIYIDDALYFHSATIGHKLDNIEQNKAVSFCVVGDTLVLPKEFSTIYESVIVFGKAREVVAGEKEKALLGLIQKYSKDYIDLGQMYISKAGNKTKVIKIEIEHISGKAKK